VIPKRPINRDVPSPEETETRPEKQAPAKEAAEPRSKPRPPRSQAPKLLGGLVVLALLFIVVAIVFASGDDQGSGGGGQATTSAPGTDSGSSDESPSPQVAEALAFPAFATNNTTRIGGPDPTANAAGVALAVFPSTTDAQRPAAVTLAAEEDWAGAIAAAVLTAPPVRAPILFSAPDAMPEDSEEALAALAPQGDRATGGASLFAIGAVALPDDSGEVTRVDSTQYPEYAMPAAAWAARSGDPILYTDTKKLPAPTIQILKKHPKTPVYVLGPSGVVSLHAIGEIGKLVEKVLRLPGPGPGDIAVDLARSRFGSFGWGVNDPGHGFVLARDDQPAAAAAAAALSASGTWGPLLLTKYPDRLPAKVRSYLLDVKPGYTTDPTRAFYNHVWVIGDQEAIDVVQQAEVNELAELTKIGGGE
jgi:hypothetical protein